MLKSSGGGWSSRSYSSEAWRIIQEGEGGEGLLSMTALVVQRGLPSPCYLLNGVLIRGTALDQYIMVLLSKEQQHLTRKVAGGELAPNTKGILR